MSRLQQQPTPTMIEPESFEQAAEVEAYEPEHPMLAFKPTAATIKQDHLDKYVEVNPFALKEAAAEEHQ